MALKNLQEIILSINLIIDKDKKSDNSKSSLNVSYQNDIINLNSKKWCENIWLNKFIL